MSSPVAGLATDPDAADPAVWTFDAIGTAWTIETVEPLPSAVRDDVAATIAEFDRTWSRFRDDSVVRALARDAASGPASVSAPADAAVMLDAYTALSEATGGAVNPLVGGSLERLGYDAAYSLRAGEPLAAPADWRALLAWQDGVLSLAAPAVLDVGALGKGRLVDLVSGPITRAIDGDVVVDASGDLAVRGAPVRIALEHPYDPRRAIGVWQVRDAALCASATTRRAWSGIDGEGLHHVLDARTGAPVRTVAATWAVAPDAMRADAIATALFFDGGPELAFEWGVSWVRMLTDGRVEWSPSCDAEVFS